MWTDILQRSEAGFTQRATDRLAAVPWARPLLQRLAASGGQVVANRPLMFEVRFALELHRAGCIVDYEHQTGVGQSTVDFRVHGPVEWLIEIVSVETSDAVREATNRIEIARDDRRVAIVEHHVLGTDATDARRTEEGEIIRAMEKIEGKVFADARAIKFPVPDQARHVIVTDMRGYLRNGADTDDYREMAYGGQAVRPEAVHWWPTQGGNARPIRGLFDPGNARPGSRLIRERIHFLGFVCEKAYREDEIRQAGYYCSNPGLFRTVGEAADAFAAYPLRPHAG